MYKAKLTIPIVFLLLGNAASKPDYSGVEDSPLCEALNYCYKGSMHYTLRQKGYKFNTRADIISKALDLDRRCSCHPSCNYFGTCCPDANTIKPDVDVSTKSFSRCLGLFGSSGVRIVDVCPPESNSTLKKLCEGKDKVSANAADVYPIQVSAGMMPYVTSAKTELTYKNVHCALCAKETKSNLLEWSLENKPLCKPTPSTPCQLLQTPPQGGIKYGDHFLSPAFYNEPIYLFVEAGDLNVCDVNLIQTCPSNSTNETTALCESAGTSIVQDRSTSKVYANIHCAECNMVKALTTCEETKIFYDWISTSTTTEAESENKDLDSVDPSSDTSSTSTSTTTDGVVTGTSTSSTSTTTTSTIGGVNFSGNGSNLSTGGFPSGSVINIKRVSNPRGEVVPKAESNSSESRSSNSVVQTNGVWYPHGTVLVADPDHPRGIVEINKDQGFPSGTVLGVENNSRSSEAPPITDESELNVMTLTQSATRENLFEASNEKPQGTLSSSAPPCEATPAATATTAPTTRKPTFGHGNTSRKSMRERLSKSKAVFLLN